MFIPTTIKKWARMGEAESKTNPNREDKYPAINEASPTGDTFHNKGVAVAQMGAIVLTVVVFLGRFLGDSVGRIRQYVHNVCRGQSWFDEKAFSTIALSIFSIFLLGILVFLVVEFIRSIRN